MLDFIVSRTALLFFVVGFFGSCKSANRSGSDSNVLAVTAGIDDIWTDTSGNQWTMSTARSVGADNGLFTWEGAKTFCKDPWVVPTLDIAKTACNGGAFAITPPAGYPSRNTDFPVWLRKSQSESNLPIFLVPLGCDTNQPVPNPRVFAKAVCVKPATQTNIVDEPRRPIGESTKVQPPLSSLTIGSYSATHGGCVEHMEVVETGPTHFEVTHKLFNCANGGKSHGANFNFNCGNLATRCFGKASALPTGEFQFNFDVEIVSLSQNEFCLIEPINLIGEPKYVGKTVLDANVDISDITAVAPCFKKQ